MEYLDVVNEDDEVIGRASKEEIYRRFLTHRIVHVLIFDEENRMLLQLRSKDLTFCPHHWSTAVGGHVQAGESYQQAALREYEEELGVMSKLVEFSKDYYVAEGVPPKFLTTFRTVYSGPFYFDQRVVERVDFFTLDEIGRMVEEGEKFHPELLFLLKKYFL